MAQFTECNFLEMLDYGYECYYRHKYREALYIFETLNQNSNEKIYDINILECKKRIVNTFVFVVDNKYINPTLVAIYSLLTNLNKDLKYKIIICCNNLTMDEKELFYALSNINQECIIETQDLNLEKYNDIFHEHNGCTGANSITALAKFDLPTLVNDEIVLYLDGDIIVKQDISELFSINISNVYAAVVRDSGKIYQNNGLRGKIKNYFNSGVMLLNLEKMRRENATQKLIEAKINLNNDSLVDQDAFNIVFQDNIILLPVKYNALMINLYNSVHKFNIFTFNDFYETNYSCIYEVEDDIKILHFASKEKPWLYKDVKYSDLWKKYFDLLNINTVELNRNNYFKKINDESKPYEIPVILATDENYAFQTCVTIISAMENASINAEYRFYILIPNLFTNEILEKFNKVASNYKNCTINFIEMKDAFKTAKLNIPHISSPTFYRLKAPSLFPQYNKIIYLDSDVIVETDLRDYYNIEMQDNYVAGVKAASYHFAKNNNQPYCDRNGIPAIDTYINAGVILMNLAELRKNNVEEDFIIRSTKGYRSQDQDIINGACYGHVKLLHYKYNCMAPKYENDSEQLLNIFTQEEINEAHNRPLIIHYAAPEKPWNSFSCALVDRWHKYAKLHDGYAQFIENNMLKFIQKGKEARKERYENSIMRVPAIKDRSLRDFIRNLTTARFDLEIVGENNDIDIIQNSDKFSTISVLKSVKTSKTYKLESNNGSIYFKCRCSGTGKFNVKIRGRETKNSDQKRIPFKIDLCSLKIDGNEYIEKIKTVWHDDYYLHSLSFVDGQIISIYSKWLLHSPEILKALDNEKEFCNKNDIILPTARLDIKNIGVGNDLIFDKISDQEAKIITPKWFQGNGTGYVISSSSGKNNISFRCKNSGKLLLSLKSEEKKYKNGNRIPNFIDLTSFRINNVEMLKDIVQIWHDDPYNIEIKVENKQALNVEYIWQNHSFELEIHEFKKILRDYFKN